MIGVRPCYIIVIVLINVNIYLTFLNQLLTKLNIAKTKLSTDAQIATVTTTEITSLSTIVLKYFLNN